MDELIFNSTMIDDEITYIDWVSTPKAKGWWLFVVLILGPFTAACGYTVIFLGLLSNFLALRLKYYGEIISGIVTAKKVKSDVHDSDKIYRIKYKYTVNDIEYKGNTSISKSDYSNFYVNQQIDIIYDPDNPKNTDIAKEDDDYFWFGIVMSMIFSNVIGLAVIFGCSYGAIIGAGPGQRLPALFGTLLFGIILSFPFCLYKCCKNNVCSCICLWKKKDEDALSNVMPKKINYANVIIQTSNL